MSTGQGFSGYNMYAYCANNPVMRVDSSGEWWWAIVAVVVPALFTGCSKKDSVNKSLPYESEEEAVRSFYDEVYAKSMYVQHEYGTEIYSKTINGKTTYDYSKPRSGEPHEVVITNVTPSGTNLVAYAHTHPNGLDFSSADKDVALDFGCNAYVVGPDEELQRYNYLSDTVTTFGKISYKTLDRRERAALKNSFQISWDNHLEEGCKFFCKYKEWPN